MGGSTKKDGPRRRGHSPGAGLAFQGPQDRRDVAMTGEVDTQGRITGVGGIAVKLETAYAAAAIPLSFQRENLLGNGTQLNGSRRP